MTHTQRMIFQAPMQTTSVLHVDQHSPRRPEAEDFIKRIFEDRYNAHVNTFTPDLMVLEQRGVIVAAAGWRSARDSTLFLERYLDTPIEQTMAHLASTPISRERIVEVGHLAAQRPGTSIFLFRAMASYLHARGFEWVASTATQELVGIFSRLGLPPLALAAANPERLNGQASDWGSYFDTQPIVAAGRIKTALQRMNAQA
ncbi:MAG: thermostable hemolysin [Rhodoferax sp.]|nr:thermostable hemolysin [Rhodoferax sp.]